MGDVTFSCTYFKWLQEKGYTCLLENMINLLRNEKFTEEAEALKTSYREAVTALPSKQRITKTTVMNKVHWLAEEVPYEGLEEKKKADYLFIEADEDHIAEQHGSTTETKDNRSFISKLVYIYECKWEALSSAARKELVNSFYFSGLYLGKGGNERLLKMYRNI